jgi:hypothetical protein
MLEATVTDNVLRVEVSKSLGTWAMIFFFSCLFVFFVRNVALELSRDSLYYWVASVMCAVCAWLSVGESEVAVLDGKKKLVWLEKKLPLRNVVRLSLGSLSNVSGVRVETDSALVYLKRLYICFDNGQSFPVTDSFLDVRRGLIAGEGAGIADTRAAVKRFLAQQKER